MKDYTTNIIWVLLGVVVSVLIIVNAPAQIGLILSVLIRVIAASAAVIFSIKYKEWRLLFLAMMLVFMGTRQTLTLFIWAGLLDKSIATQVLSEIPGYIVTVLSVISIFYVGEY